MKNFFYLFMVLTSSLIISCQNEENDVPEASVNKSEPTQLQLLKDVATVISVADNSKFIFDFAEMAVKEADRYECVYMDNIINTTTRGQQNLATLMLNEINANINDYESLYKREGTRSVEATIEDLESLEVEFYIPYNENFEDVPTEVTVGYHPLVQEDWTDGYLIREDGSKEYVSYIDDEYAKQNLTVIVMPKEDNTQNEMAVTAEKSDFIPIVGPTIITPITPSIPNGLLKQNITNSALIDEDDVLYTRIHALRINGTGWMKFLQTKQRLAIYRASSDIVWHENIYQESGATFHKAIYVEIPRQDCKDGVWHTGNMVFDDDWDLHETNQKIFFVSEHNASVDITLNATVGVGLQNGVPSVEASAEAKVSLSLKNNSKLRLHNELIRKSILANNVGDLGGGTYTIDDTEFAIRTYGLADVVFAFNYTKID